MFVIRLFYAFMQMPMPKYQQNLIIVLGIATLIIGYLLSRLPSLP